jgi:hypothetical protein
LIALLAQHSIRFPWIELMDQNPFKQTGEVPESAC